MKYYAFVEENQSIENARMCPTMETAFAVAIMANTEKPAVAVRNEYGDVITIDPRQELIKIDWIMRSEFILVDVDGDVLTLSSCDDIPSIKSDTSLLLVHYASNKYAVGNIGRKFDIDDIKSRILSTTIDNSRYECGIGPLVKKVDRIKFDRVDHCIEGNLDDHGYVPDMDPRLVPEGKVLVINGAFGDATEMKFVGKLSSLMKIREDSTEMKFVGKLSSLMNHESFYSSDYKYYVQNKGKFYNLKKAKITSINL